MGFGGFVGYVWNNIKKYEKLKKKYQEKFYKYKCRKKIKSKEKPMIYKAYIIYIRWNA